MEELGPLHAARRSVPRTARTVGFLIFHWHAVQALKDLRLDRSLRVSPYSAEDFESGPFKEVGWTSWMSDVPDAVDLDGLVAYSEAIEAWHNEAHMTIGDVTGAPMMEPRINIFFRPFWNLHTFINGLFDTQLRSYAAATKLKKTSPNSIVSDIETRHAAYLRRI